MKKMLLAGAALSAVLVLAPETSRAQSDLPLSTGNGTGLWLIDNYLSLEDTQERIHDGRNVTSMAEGRRNLEAYQRSRALGNVVPLPR